MITPTIRFYLPDVLEYGDYKNMSDILNHTHCHRVFFWYEKNDLTQKQIKNFVDTWGEFKHQNFKTHIQAMFTDLQRDFIWYDFMPHRKLKENPAQYYRFRWEYGLPESIEKGLTEFKSTYDFVTESQNPQKKQKRNDGENSNHR
tara:strand:+ start:519 stop:953 length:435 start_codon:yes stop_codon:yes gene_type:complete